MGIGQPTLAREHKDSSKLVPATISAVTEQGQTYVVTGTVQALSYLLSQGAYQLKDDTGSIWIITPNPMPRIGDRVYVKAQSMYRSIQVQGQEFGEYYLMEIEQLSPQSVGLSGSLEQPNIVSPSTVPSNSPRSLTIDDFLYPHWWKFN